MTAAPTILMMIATVLMVVAGTSKKRLELRRPRPLRVRRRRPGSRRS